MTDIEGNYSISVPNGEAVLIFTFMGYKTVSETVGNRTTINVTMVEEASALDEVVVIGYGAQRKEAVTGSVASMSGAKLAEVQTGNVTSALAGRVAGVQLTQTSSKPGDDMQIRIRGTRSFSGDNNPLVVLDGIPFAGSIGDINPNDIKSVDILKDASATAIYGSRGANGVIMVTSKKGTAGQSAKVTYNGYYGIKSLYNRYPMMSGPELVKLRQAAALYSNSIDESDDTDTDWQDLMFGTGETMSHDVAVSGGTETGSYNLGAGYYKDQSVLPGQNYSRINLRASIDQSIGKYLRAGLTTNNNYNMMNGRSIGMYNTLALSPLINPRDADGNWKTIVKDPVNGYWAYSREAIENLGDKYADNQRGYASYNSLYGEVKAPFLEGLTYRINLGLNLRGTNRGRYQGTGVFSDTPTAASTGSLDKSMTTQWVVENVITFDKFFNKHHINFTGLYSAEQTRYERSLVEAIRIPADFFQYWNLGQAAKADVTVDPKEQKFHETALVSWMGRVMYDYDSRYMLSLALRSDGSSRLAPGHKWHTYPAVSAGWNIKRETFMESVEWLGNLKLRAGWGQTSNQAVSPYATLGSLDIRPYNFGDFFTTGLFVSEVANPALGWEFTAATNIGLDFSLFRNRLSGNIEYYTTNTDNILYKVHCPRPPA
jgi:TonB-linked SusC/RagA family outer membrane protein